MKMPKFWRKKALSEIQGVGVIGQVGPERFIPLIPYLPPKIKLLSLFSSIEFILKNQRLPAYSLVLDKQPRKKDRFIRTVLLECQKTPALLNPQDLGDALRIVLGETVFLTNLEQFYEPGLFHVIFGVQTPKECEILRQKGCSLFFWKDYDHPHRWHDFTFNRVSFDEILRDPKATPSDVLLIFQKLISSFNSSLSTTSHNTPPAVNGEPMSPLLKEDIPFSVSEAGGEPFFMSPPAFMPGDEAVLSTESLKEFPNSKSG